ncbi:unnamed protein product, partial [marine sediment metagenome]
MRAYIIRRLLLIIPTLLLVTIISFFLARLIPGDVIDLMLAEQPVLNRELTRIELERALGLDIPIYVQYGRWLGVVPHPDTGFSGILQGD